MIQFLSSNRRISSSSTYKIGLFFVIIFWYQKRKRLRDSSDDDDHLDTDENLKDVGPRGLMAIKKPPSYWNGFLNCLQVGTYSDISHDLSYKSSILNNLLLFDLVLSGQFFS